MQIPRKAGCLQYYQFNLQEAIEGPHVVGVEPDGVAVVGLGHLQVLVPTLGVADLGVPEKDI